MSDKMSGLIWILPDTDGFPDFFLGGGGLIVEDQQTTNKYAKFSRMERDNNIILSFTLANFRFV